MWQGDIRLVRMPRGVEQLLSRWNCECSDGQIERGPGLLSSPFCSFSGMKRGDVEPVVPKSTKFWPKVI